MHSKDLLGRAEVNELGGCLEQGNVRQLILIPFERDDVRIRFGIELLGCRRADWNFPLYPLSTRRFQARNSLRDQSISNRYFFDHKMRGLAVDVSFQYRGHLQRTEVFLAGTHADQRGTAAF